jgi:hypothetical protein
MKWLSALGCLYIGKMSTGPIDSDLDHSAQITKLVRLRRPHRTTVADILWNLATVIVFLLICHWLYGVIRTNLVHPIVKAAFDIAAPIETPDNSRIVRQR